MSTDSLVLSVCIPTYNRCDAVVPLVKWFLSHSDKLEVCVHVDGSEDGTWTALTQLGSERLRLSEAPNQGRAGALASAAALATGKFLMVFDDDDELSIEGLQQVISDCDISCPDTVAGFIYHFHDDQGRLVGTRFPCERANLLSLRADWGVHGDKKEVVRSAVFKRYCHHLLSGYRRVPTSLIWAEVALEYDIVCRDLVIGRKHYLADGMTAAATRLKRENAGAMLRLYRTRVRGFFGRRYRSVGYLLQSLTGVLWYGLLSVMQRRG